MTDRPKQTHKLSPEDVLKIIELFDSGLNYSQIARNYNVTPRTVKLQIEKTGRKARYKGKLPTSMHPQILQEFSTGEHTIKSLAEKYNVTPQSMSSLLKNLGVYYSEEERSDVYRKYPVNHSYFDKIDAPHKAYILGLFYADACNYPSDNKITISLKSEDREILEKVQNVIQPSKPLYHRPPYERGGIKSSGHYTLCILSKSISHRLNDLGCSPSKSLNLVWPKWLTPEHTPHFVRGFFDGDGGVCMQRGRRIVNFAANIDFLKSLQSVLVSEIGAPQNKLTKHSISNLHYYQFSAKKDVKNFQKWIYDNADGWFLARKYSKFTS